MAQLVRLVPQEAESLVQQQQVRLEVELLVRQQLALQVQELKRALHHRR
jgi:hypothetical protein